MASSGSVFSETLQTITTTKLEELAEQRLTFEKQYKSILETVPKIPNRLERLFALIDGVKSSLGVLTVTSKDGTRGGIVTGSSGNPRLETDLKNLDRFLEQARYDPSVSPKVLENWEKLLFQYLSVQSAKYEYADLYGRLVTEWLSSEKSVITDDDTYEEVPGEKHLEARGEWEKVVFEPAHVDQGGLMDYLDRLFGASEEDGSKISEIPPLLADLRRKVQSFENGLSGSQQFNVPVLKWVIQGLQASDLLSNEKREVLKDFLGNDVIMSEIADVLNMRMAALGRWSWGDHVMLEERRSVSGGYSIHMHEDLLQAIFLHYIGVKWSVFFKDAFGDFREGFWKANRATIPKTERLRREYYLGSDHMGTASSLQDCRERAHRKLYFSHQLLDEERQSVEVQEGEEEADFKDYQGASQMMPQPQAPMATQRARHMASLRKQTTRKSIAVQAPGSYRRSARLHSTSEEADDDYDDDDSGAKNPMKAKQKLLHLVATEIVLNTRLYGELTCFRSVFKSWNPLLPHDTILTVLEFLGISGKWRTFFKTFLQAPLKFADDQASTPRLRRRGTPGSHALSDVFGEVVLACLDLAVNQSTDGGMLYRLYDDIWFWSKEYEKCAKAWESVRQFAAAMNVEIDDVKTGSVRILGDKARNDCTVKGVDERLPAGEIRWGFLFLDETTGRFEIDEKMVTGHIEELRIQLQGKSKSVIDWIQTWNTYASTFFSSNFGKPSNCFGREHVNKMLATHRRIQEKIFDGGNVVQFLKETIEKRFQVKEVPEGFLFFPVELGGLDLKSSFVGLLQIRESVKENPYDFLDEFEKKERKNYADAKAVFDKGGTYRIHGFSSESIDFQHPQDRSTFFPFEEYIARREEYTPRGYADIVHMYRSLMSTPRRGSIDGSIQVKQAVEELNGRGNLKGITSNWEDMEPYWKWVAQMYGPEMCDRFGGLTVVDQGLLPIGMVSMFREKRIKWQG